MNSGNLIFNICMSEAHCALPGDFKLKVNMGPVPERPPGLRPHGPSCVPHLQRGNPNDPTGTGQEKTQAQTLVPDRVVVKVDPGSDEADGGSGPQDATLLSPAGAGPAHGHHPGVPGPGEMVRSTIYGSSVCGEASTPSCPKAPRHSREGENAGAGAPRP